MTRHAPELEGTGSTCRSDDDCRRQSVRTTRSLVIATLVGAATAAVPQGSYAQVSTVTFSNAACTLSGTTLSCSATSVVIGSHRNVTFSNLACALDSAGTALDCAPPPTAGSDDFFTAWHDHEGHGVRESPANDTAVIRLAGEAAGSGNTVKFANGQNCQVNSLTLDGRCLLLGVGGTGGLDHGRQLRTGRWNICE